MASASRSRWNPSIYQRCPPHHLTGTDSPDTLDWMNSQHQNRSYQILIAICITSFRLCQCTSSKEIHTVQACSAAMTYMQCATSAVWIPYGRMSYLIMSHKAERCWEMNNAFWSFSKPTEPRQHQQQSQDRSNVPVTRNSYWLDWSQCQYSTVGY